VFSLGFLSLWWCLVRIWGENPHSGWISVLFLWGTTLFLAARGCLEGVVVVIGDCWMVLVAVLDFGGGDGSGFGLVVVVMDLVSVWWWW
jgi:hypothetical protein